MNHNLDKKINPYGAWPSPVTAELVAGQSLRFGLARAHGGDIYWTEGRPAEAGRSAIMRRRADGTTEELLPPPFSARSAVHEYGGGEFLVTDSGVYFTNASDQDVYCIAVDGEISRLTHQKGWRFADFCLDRAFSRLIAVGEYHDGDHDPKPENALVAIKLAGAHLGRVSRLISGADFYANPTLSPDGKSLAWLEWDLPAMPWDDARLLLCELASGGIVGAAVHVAGGDGSAVFQPEWAMDGTLYFVWDKTGWGQLYRWQGASAQQIFHVEAECGLPLWGLGTRSYALISAKTAFITCFDKGEGRAAIADLESGALSWLETGLANVHGPVAVGDKITALATAHDRAPFIGLIDRSGRVETVRESASLPFSSDEISTGRVISVDRDGGTVWAVYYPPRNASFDGPGGDAPPMIVSAHGGPTGMADRGLKLKIQYWTSRGFAYLDVDYAGSWGYGRAYMESLNGKWGLADVNDVAIAAQAMVAQGLADEHKLFISGGSAGGYTVLCALAFSDDFRAGASYYGIGDLTKLLEFTHKFESGYIYALTGTSEGKIEPVFSERSPLAHASGISVPVIFFQGAKDFVVPPDQSRDMAASLRQRGVPVAYLEFPNESHGFRASEVISRCLEAEYGFYARIMELPAGKLAALEIDNEEAL
jgi:dipeptidyl aminopeptidase/acylaminoacyl peptidase